MKRLIPTIALAGAIFLTPAHAGPIDITASTGTTATQSSDFPSGLFPASKGIDGDTTNFTSTAVGDPAHSWTADFNRDITLGSLVIHNRDDCCAERLSDKTRHLGNWTEASIVHSHQDYPILILLAAFLSPTQADPSS